MRMWCTCILLLWCNEVLGYGEMPYGGASGQSIRIGKSIVTRCRIVAHLLIFYSTQSGLITDDATERMRQTFEHAIAVVNSDISVPLVGDTQQVDYGNSVQAFSQLCQLMQVRIIHEILLQTNQ